MQPHATPPQSHHFPGAAHLPGPNPHASSREGDTSGPLDDRRKELAGYSYLATVPRWRESRGPKRTPALESPEALSKLTPVDSPLREAEGGQGSSQLEDQQTCQGHGWSAMRVPHEERETRSVGRAGWRLLLALEPGSEPEKRRPSCQAGWWAGWRVLSVRPSILWAWGSGDVGACVRAGVQDCRPVLQQQ